MAVVLNPSSISPIEPLPDPGHVGLGTAPPLRIGFIGYGYWGPNVVRNFAEVAGAQVWAVSDMREERLAQVHSRYPGVTTTTDCQKVIDDPAIDAGGSMTPVSTPYKLTKHALRGG